ncbi:hypothetical protein HaLaN_23252, partial [Haematococcus lacustris]
MMESLLVDLANAGKQSFRHTLVGEILKQVHKYGVKRPVATHIDTRFAILFTICKDILRSKDALRMMVEQGDWNKIAASSTNTACFDVLKD